MIDQIDGQNRIDALNNKKYPDYCSHLPRPLELLAKYNRRHQRTSSAADILRLLARSIRAAFIDGSMRIRIASFLSVIVFVSFIRELVAQGYRKSNIEIILDADIASDLSCLQSSKGDHMRLTDCALIDQGLLAVEVMPNVPKWQIAPTPAHEEEAWERHARAPRSAYQQVGPRNEAHGDERGF